MLLSLEKAIFSWLGHYVGESTMGTKTAEHISMRLVKSSKPNVPPICFSLCSDAEELGSTSSNEDATLHEQFHYFLWQNKRREKVGRYTWNASGETGGSEFYSGLCHSIWPRATLLSVWDHLFAPDCILNKTSWHWNSHCNPQHVVGGTAHISTSPVKWESFDGMTHTLLLWKVNSLPGHEGQCPIATFVLRAAGIWSQLVSLGTTVVRIITTPPASAKCHFPGFDHLVPIRSDDTCWSRQTLAFPA